MSDGPRTLPMLCGDRRERLRHPEGLLPKLQERLLLVQPKYPQNAFN